MYIKVHKGQHDDVIAICDEDILGKTFENEHLKITVSEHFYRGEKKDAVAITRMLRDATNVNFIGKEAVDLGIKIGMIKKENIKVIAGIPHAQAYT